jgi:hypothetical protein
MNPYDVYHIGFKLDQSARTVSYTFEYQHSSWENRNRVVFFLDAHGEVVRIVPSGEESFENGKLTALAYRIFMDCGDRLRYKVGQFAPFVEKFKLLHELMDVDLSTIPINVVEIASIKESLTTVWFSFTDFPYIQFGYRFSFPGDPRNGIDALRPSNSNSEVFPTNCLFADATKLVEKRIQEHPKFRLLNLLGI